MKSGLNSTWYTLGLAALVLLAVEVLAVSCSPVSITEMATSPLGTATLPPATPALPTQTPTCNPPWPTPPSEACPWLPTPTPEPTFPTSTPFVVPTPVQTPTPLPLSQAADSPAGSLLFAAFFAPGTAPSEPQLLRVLIDEQGQPAGSPSLVTWTPLGDNLMEIGRLRVSPNGTYLASIFETEVGESVVVVDLTSTRETAYVHEGQFLNWHPNGYEFLFASWGSSPGLWLVEASTGQHRLLAQPAELSYANISGATISPDGQVLAYSINGPGIAQVWIANADGSEPRLMSDSAMAVFTWSPDGRYLLYSGEYQPEGARGTPSVLPHLWLVDREKQNRQPLGLSWESGITFALYQLPVWSPTGQYVANSAPLDVGIPFWEKGEDHRSDRLYPFRNTGVYVESVETGEMWLAAPNAVDPTWSPDGSMLAVAKMDENEQVDIWLVNINDRSLHRLMDTPELDRYPVWLRVQE